MSHYPRAGSIEASTISSTYSLQGFSGFSSRANGGNTRRMSRYFFHIRDGLIFVPDDEGMDCRTMKAIEEEARASAQDLAKVALLRRPYSTPPMIEVEDDEGNAIEVAAMTWLH